MVGEIRTVKLNILELTEAKDSALKNLRDMCMKAGKVLLNVSDNYNSRYSLQEGEYRSIKEKYSLHLIWARRLHPLG